MERVEVRGPLTVARPVRPTAFAAGMDGYPECAALLLDVLPAAVLDRHPNARGIVAASGARARR
jgi:hypothetical protein